ncbi:MULTISPECIES: carbon-nitrogen hydrolase family protein [Burkholderia]|uniref:Carbon-nitrogen hydrolase family protein n=2 Tax=Burkholderia cepacia complex TaxID=87882 RepID=A0A3R9C7Z7_9BURK|nr:MULTISPECIES: carbon-nitrogen hydrolase family protein [Burkholderia]EKS9845466.1 carbon-nitrogen hydrolase family protein [Burkholderia cepacia]BEV49050.1 carbon-nitrogen hydrolase family protein [Burkholderia contaminans]ABK10730.1 Nitrilase/cyanide hydratase and apolipoprotein N-acyltransferase [Burkholderia cenocepacia HI2424]AQT52466.1 carbon-nitrogen hydrolase [Burkholderia cenocepacia]MBJ9668720.1 carbon-nitrogen hydrolase family protein [Burkholderia cenocepacia]
MQVELAQLSLVDGDVAHNTRKVIDTIERVDVAGGTKLIVFPETTLSGFPTRENVAEVAETLDGPRLLAVRDAARRTGVAVAVGLAERDGGRFYNTTVLVDERGDIILRYRKTHLWASDVGVFTPGDRFATCAWNGLTVGLLICYDIEFPETARAIGALDADLLIVTNGNMDPFGPVHRRAIAARAMENQMFAVMVNRCGAGDDDLTFAGLSTLVDPFGDSTIELGRDEAVAPANLDLTRLEASREHYSYLHDARVALGLSPVEQADGGRVLTIDACRHRAE